MNTQITSDSPQARYIRMLVTAALVLSWLSAFVVSHIPQQQMPQMYTSDIVLHVAGFFLLGTLLFWTLVAWGVRPIARVAWMLGALPLYAAIDEMTQPIMNRVASFDDWLADLLGAAAAYVVCELVLLVIRRRR